MANSLNADNTCLDWKTDVNEEEKTELTDKLADVNADENKLQSSGGLFCDPCIFDKAEQKAVGFCKSCAEYLCEQCMKEHKKGKATRRHCILEENLPEDQEIFKTMKRMISCKCHPEISVTSKCVDHNEFVCPLCIAETHKKCYLHDFKTQSDEMFATSAVFETLDILQLTCETTRLRKESNKTTVLHEQAAVQSDVGKFVVDVNERVKELGKAMLIEMEEVTRERLSNIESDQQDCRDMEEAIVMQRKLLQASVSFGNDSDEHIVSKVMSERLQHDDEKVRNIAAKKTEDMQFKGTSHLLELQSIGEIKLKTNGENCVVSCIAQSSDEIQESTLGPTHTTTHSQDCFDFQEIQTPSMDKMFDKTATVHNIKLSDDKNQCSVQGMVILHDSSIVLIDPGNTAIKVFTEDFSFTCAFHLDDTPTDICLFDEDIVALSFLNSKKIDRFNIEDSCIFYYDGFKTRLYNLSVATYEDNIAVLMSDQKLMVEKDSERDVIEIQFRDPENGQYLFTLDNFMSKGLSYRSLVLWNPTRLRFNEEDDLLIVEPDKVTCFEYCSQDTEAIVEWYYKARQNSPEYGLSSVASDTESVYFCADNGAIGQVSSSNFRNKRLLETNIDRPTSVYLDRERKRLLVGCFNDNYVHVYRYK